MTRQASKNSNGPVDLIGQDLSSPLDKYNLSADITTTAGLHPFCDRRMGWTSVLISSVAAWLPSWRRGLQNPSFDN